MVTGKPLELGGSLGRKRGHGPRVWSTSWKKYALRAMGINLAETTAVIQGLRQRRRHGGPLLARARREGGGVGDITGALYDERGSNIAALLEHRERHGVIEGFAGGEPITNEELLALPCDVLIPAAMENQITRSERRARCGRRSLSKAPTGPPRPRPTTSSGERAIVVIPDILANAGGVTVSYFEWVQGLERYQWDEDEVNQRLRQKMVRALHEVMAVAEKDGLPYRRAAYALALRRVAEAVRLRGIFP